MIDLIRKLFLLNIVFTSIDILGQGININFENSQSYIRKNNLSINPNYGKNMEISRFRVTYTDL